MTEETEVLPKVYDVEDIQKILGLGRSRTYQFLEEVYQKQEPFHVKKMPKKSYPRMCMGIQKKS